MPGASWGPCSKTQTGCRLTAWSGLIMELPPLSLHGAPSIFPFLKTLKYIEKIHEKQTTFDFGNHTFRRIQTSAERSCLTVDGQRFWSPNSSRFRDFNSMSSSASGTTWHVIGKCWHLNVWHNALHLLAKAIMFERFEGGGSREDSITVPWHLYADHSCSNF